MDQKIELKENDTKNLGRKQSKTFFQSTIIHYYPKKKNIENNTMDEWKDMNVPFYV